MHLKSDIGSDDKRLEDPLLKWSYSCVVDAICCLGASVSLQRASPWGFWGVLPGRVTNRPVQKPHCLLWLICWSHILPLSPYSVGCTRSPVIHCWKGIHRAGITRAHLGSGYLPDSFYMAMWVLENFIIPFVACRDGSTYFSVREHWSGKSNLNLFAWHELQPHSYFHYPFSYIIC